MSKKTLLLIVIVTFELFSLAYLGFKIINGKKAVSITKIDRNNIDIRGTQTLKYFYDLKPNHVEETVVDWLPKKVINTINRDGFNDRFDYKVGKPENVYRIIALGDSYTYGVYIDTKNNWTEVLEDKLNENANCQNYDKFEVINLGVYGYDIEYAVEKYRSQGQKYNPDLVIWMLTDNARILEKSLPLVKNCQEKYRDDKVPTYSCEKIAQTRLKNILGSKNVYTYLIQSFDRLFDFYNNKVVVYDFKSRHDPILKMSKNLENLKVINDVEFLDNESLQLQDDHPNEKGHQYFADQIHDYLVKNKLINCEKVN